MVRTNAGAVEKRHAEFNTLLLSPPKQARIERLGNALSAAVTPFVTQKALAAECLKKDMGQVFDLIGDPGKTRTSDLRFRNGQIVPLLQSTCVDGFSRDYVKLQQLR